MVLLFGICLNVILSELNPELSVGYVISQHPKPSSLLLLGKHRAISSHNPLTAQHSVSNNWDTHFLPSPHSSSTSLPKWLSFWVLLVRSQWFNQTNVYFTLTVHVDCWLTRLCSALSTPKLRALQQNSPNPYTKKGWFWDIHSTLSPRVPWKAELICPQGSLAPSPTLVSQRPPQPVFPKIFPSLGKKVTVRGQVKSLSSHCQRSPSWVNQTKNLFISPCQWQYTPQVCLQRTEIKLINIYLCKCIS